jgi:hypothetical protein
MIYKTKNMRDTSIKVDSPSDKKLIEGYFIHGKFKDIKPIWDKIGLHKGTNFDLSNYINEIDENKEVMILVDFLHRVMIYYHQKTDFKRHNHLSIDEFVNRYC